MFAAGTQKKYWLFSGEEEINKLRAEANERYIKQYGQGKSVSSPKKFLCPVSVGNGPSLSIEPLTPIALALIAFAYVFQTLGSFQYKKHISVFDLFIL